MDVPNSCGYQVSEYFNYSIDELQANEMECFVRFVAERSRNNPARSRVLTPAEPISYSLMDVRSLYSQAIKKKRGGWSCGTHTNNVRMALARLIASKYCDDQINRFINLCATCVDARNFLQDVDMHIKVMAEEFLSMRPEPCVHPSHSWWKKMLEEEK